MTYQTQEGNPTIPHPPLTWGWRDIVAVILLVGVGMFVLLTIVRLLTTITGWDVGVGLTSPVLYLVSTGIYGLLFYGVYQFAARQSGWQALGIRMPPWWTIGITPLLLIVEFTGMIAINKIIAQIRGKTFENPQIEALTGGQTIDPGALLLLLFLIAIIAPIVEELFFRGMIYPWLRTQGGPILAILASAAIFAALHFIPLLMPALFFIGLILGLLREWSKSIIPCILLHMMQNAVVVVGMSMLAAQQ
jgi:membrane protease YdiL (CAAX protease family)